MTEPEHQRKIRHRLAVLAHAEEVTGNVARTCRYYGISRPTFYKWRNRYAEHGEDGLRDRPSRPTNPRARPRPTWSARSSICARTTTSSRSRSPCTCAGTTTCRSPPRACGESSSAYQLSPRWVDSRRPSVDRRRRQHPHRSATTRSATPTQAARLKTRARAHVMITGQRHRERRQPHPERALALPGTPRVELPAMKVHSLVATWGLPLSRRSAIGVSCGFRRAGGREPRRLLHIAPCVVLR